MRTLLSTGSIALVLVASATHCERERTNAETPTVAPRATGPLSPTATAPVAAPPVAPPQPVTASGPHAVVNGDHYALTANLAAPPAVPGDTALTVEVHGGTGYHVNQLYPVALDLTPANATAPARLHRTDVAELSEHVARFNVPVHVTGAGASLQGTMRFAVCSDENCVPHTETFAVALP